MTTYSYNKKFMFGAVASLLLFPNATPPWLESTLARIHLGLNPPWFEFTLA